MKKIGILEALVFSASLVIGLAACSNASGGENFSIGEKKLDLRIKKNGIPYGSNVSTCATNELVEPARMYFSKSVSPTNGDVSGNNFDERLWTADRHQTTHCKVEEDGYNGVYFTITRPSADCYDPSKGGGWGYVVIYRYEKISGKNMDTTRASPPNNRGNEITVLYPLCEPGERYVFHIIIEPKNVNANREAVVDEFLSVIAKDGVGDIDYSNINNAGHLDLQYNGGRPILKLLDCIPPDKVKNLKSTMMFFAGTQEWKQGTTYDIENGWFSKDGVVYQFDPYTTDETQAGFKNQLNAKGKKQFFAQWLFVFDVEEAPGLNFGTLTLWSNYAYIE